MHRIHDFTGKLRQPAIAPSLAAYVEWRRALARAEAAGTAPPEPPDLAPVSINLDLTTACNYRCAHCIDWDTLNTKHKFRDATLRDSLERMQERGLRSVILIGGGEPTLYPHFADFVAWLKALGLQVAIVSNGSRGRILLDAAPHLDERDWIRLSLDSGSNELFTAMHKPTRADVDLDTICSWVPRIKEANPRVRVGFSYIIVWGGASRGVEGLQENIHEIVLAAERARKWGFDYIAFKPVLERRAEGAEVMDPEKSESETALLVARIRAEVEKAKELADERFSVYESINLRLLEDGRWEEFTRQPRTCHMQAFRQVLAPTGLYNCPAHRGVSKARIAGPDAYRGEPEAHRTSGALAEILAGFDASHECREVTCLYNGVNWWLERLVRDPSLCLEAEVGEESLDYFL